MNLKVLNFLSTNRRIIVQSRSYDLVEYPSLPRSSNNIWSVKTLPILKKPRYVVFGFQTARKDVRVEDASKFDKCHATDMRLHLNTQIFPYQRNELDIEGGIYSELYNAYANIQYSYYNNTDPTNLIGYMVNSKTIHYLFLTHQEQMNRS